MGPVAIGPPVHPQDSRKLPLIRFWDTVRQSCDPNSGGNSPGARSDLLSALFGRILPFSKIRSLTLSTARALLMTLLGHLLVLYPGSLEPLFLNKAGQV